MRARARTRVQPPPAIRSEARPASAGPAGGGPPPTSRGLAEARRAAAACRRLKMKSSRRQRVRLAASRAAGRKEPPPAEGVLWRLFACRPTHWRAGCLGGAGRPVADRGRRSGATGPACGGCTGPPYALCGGGGLGCWPGRGGGPVRRACQTGADGRLCDTARTNRPAHLSRLGGGGRFWLRRLDHRGARGVVVTRGCDPGA